MRRNASLRVSAVVIAFALLAVAPITAAASTPAQVRSAVKKLNGKAGAYVLDLETNRRIASKRASTKRIIASNAKLYTAAAVLDRFGPDGRFSTGLWTAGSVNGGVITGDVYLRGGGDPLFGSASFVGNNFGSRATAERLALNLRSTGITRITGRIIGDESVFDGRRGTAKYRYRANWEIGGSLSGLVFNKGLSRGRFQSNPPHHAAGRMRAALRSAGIRVGARISTGRTPKSAKRVAFVASLPMSALVRQMNKPSNNYLAEMLVKTLALPAAAANPTGGVVPIGSRRATTRAGTRIARRHAASLGGKVALSDGSGLSRSDRAAPREVVDLLRATTGEPAFDEFETSLAIVGVDGTLAKRMRGTPAHRNCSGKTGTLSNVSALAGYCITAGGRRVAFAILQNVVAPYLARAQQDRVVARIAALR
ncbi:MAG: D-alanyl-D-alanine carboxypeptidase/D-alanyl-D-alanine endopeptidase [Solirubrobacterales bacterium]